MDDHNIQVEIDAVKESILNCEMEIKECADKMKSPTLNSDELQQLSHKENKLRDEKNKLRDKENKLLDLRIKLQDEKNIILSKQKRLVLSQKEGMCGALKSLRLIQILSSIINIVLFMTFHSRFSIALRKIMDQQRRH